MGLEFEKQEISKARFQAIPSHFPQNLPVGYERLRSHKGGLASVVPQPYNGRDERKHS